MDEKAQNLQSDPKTDKTLLDLAKVVVEMKNNLDMLNKSVLYDGKMLRILQGQILNLVQEMDSSHGIMLKKLDQLAQNQNALLHHTSVDSRSVGVFTTASISDTVPNFLVYPTNKQTPVTSLTPTQDESVFAVMPGAPPEALNNFSTSRVSKTIDVSQVSTTSKGNLAESTLDSSRFTTSLITAEGDHLTRKSRETCTTSVCLQDVLKPRQQAFPEDSAPTNTATSSAQILNSNRHAFVPMSLADTHVSHHEYLEVPVQSPTQTAVKPTHELNTPIAIYSKSANYSLNKVIRIEAANRNTTSDCADKRVVTDDKCAKQLEIPIEKQMSDTKTTVDIPKSSKFFSRAASKNALIPVHEVLTPPANEANKGFVETPTSKCKTRSTLLTAAAAGNAEEVMRILETEISTDIRQRDTNGNMPLHLAALGGHDRVAMVLLSAGADVNAPGRRLRSPLHCAATRGHKSVARLLLANDAIADAKDAAGETPLLLAARRGHESIVQLLQRKDVDVNAIDTDGRTPIMWAAAKNHLQVVKHLMHQSTLSEVDRDGKTALMLAAVGGHWKTVELLLGAGSPVDGRNKNGETILDLATKAEQWNIVKTISGNQRLAKKLEKSKTVPLHLAVGNGDAGAVRDLLLLEDFTDEELEGAFVLVKDANVVRAFSEQARRIVRGSAGLDVFWNAAKSGDKNLLEAMLEAGTDVNARNNFRNTALHYAAYNGHTECVKLLLQRGALKNARGNRGRTPLYDAAEQGKEECVRALLIAGAYVTLKSEEGKTPLEAAKTEYVRAMLANYLDCPLCGN